MNIPSNYFFIIDILIVIIFVLCMAISYRNGVIYELVSLLLIFISLFLSFLFSPILAKRYYLIKPDLSAFPTLNPVAILNGINVVVWFIVLVVVFSLLILLLKPLFKKLTKVPVVGWVNKLFGIIIGFIKGLFVCFILSYFLTFPIIKNGKDVKNGSFIKYSDTITNKSISFIINNIDFDKINEGIENFDSKATRDAIESFFVEKGILNG